MIRVALVALSVLGLTFSAPAVRAAEEAAETKALDARTVARWILRLGGHLTLVNQKRPVKHLSELPPGQPAVRVVDLLGAHLVPADLARLMALPDLEELYLPAYIWNETCCDGKPHQGDKLAVLAPLVKLHKLIISVHFLTWLLIEQSGIEAMGKLPGIQEVRVIKARMPAKGFAGLTQLRAVDLSESRATNEGIASLAALTHLERLRARDTLLSDEGIAHLSHLTSLVELDLEGCRITDVGMKALAGLTNVRRLNLLGAQVTDAGLKSLGGMNELVELNLFRNPITNASVEWLKTLKHLESLDLRYTRVTRSAVEGLRAALPRTRINFVDPSIPPAAGGKLGPLHEGTNEAAFERWLETAGGSLQRRDGVIVQLSLARTAVADAHMSTLTALGFLQHIEELDLQATDLGDSGLGAAAALPGLRRLNLDGINVGDSALQQLEKIPGLRHLSLRGARVSVPAVARLVRLEYLDLSNTAATDLAPLAALTALRSLRLAFTETHDADLKVLGTLRFLETLDLSATEISDAGMSQLATFKTLTTLFLNHNGGLSDKAIANLGPLPRLRSLELARTAVSDKGRPALSRLKTLERLILDGTQITDDSATLARELPALTELGLDHSKVTDTGAFALVTHGKNLRILDVDHTAISEAGHKRLQEGLPRCRIRWHSDKVPAVSVR